MGNNLNTITITTTVKATTIATVKMSMRLNRSLKFKFGGKKRRSSTVGGSISSSFSKNAAEQDYEDYPQYDPEDFESDSDSDDSEEEEIYSSPPVSPQSLQAQQCPATWSASSTVSKDDGKKKNIFGRKVLSKAAKGNSNNSGGGGGSLLENFIEANGNPNSNNDELRSLDSGVKMDDSFFHNGNNSSHHAPQGNY